MSINAFKTRKGLVCGALAFLLLCFFFFPSLPSCGKKEVVRNDLTGVYLTIRNEKKLDYIEVSGTVGYSPIFSKRRFPVKGAESLEPGEHSLAIMVSDDLGDEMLALRVDGYVDEQKIVVGFEEVTLLTGQMLEVYMILEKAPECGDGVIDEGEECDDENVVSGDGCSESCEVEEGYTCTGEPSSCEELCGNGNIDEGEDCEGEDLGDETCQSLGFNGGTLFCGEDCMFDVSNCTGEGPVCGNSEVEYGEECDGDNLDGATCESFGFDGGELGCDGECEFVIDKCTGCGNGFIEEGEDCDGEDLDGETCESLDYDGGELACDDNCEFDTQDCVSCQDEWTYCGGTPPCVDTNTNPSHCGGCGNECAVSEPFCKEGSCSLTP